LQLDDCADGQRTEWRLRQGLAAVRANANFDHFTALLILVCSIVAMYLAMEEISHAMGEGALTRLFFERPKRA
jgi:hypothetical protein